MTNYYDNQKDYEQRGIDYDLVACLEYNPQGTFGIDDIERVLAVYEGSNDEEDWRWVLKLKRAQDGGRFVFLQGGCDYTGWDCQSWATHAFAKRAGAAANLALGNVPIVGGGPENAGLGHMIQILGGTYSDKFVAVRDALVEQLASRKNKTWRENKDAEFGIGTEPK